MSFVLGPRRDLGGYYQWERELVSRKCYIYCRSGSSTLQVGKLMESIYTKVSENGVSQVDKVVVNALSQ